MRKILVKLAKLLPAILLSLTVAGTAVAQSSGEQVTTSSQRLNHALRGVFSFRDLNSYYSYVPSVGTLTFDGNGNVTGTMDINDDTTVCQGTSLSGTYTVNPDKLTATATLTLSTTATGCSSLNNVTIPLSLSLVRDGSGVVTVINMAEMDNGSPGTFYSATDSFFGAVGQRTAK